MKNKILNLFLAILLVPAVNFAQEKKWTLEECVRFAIQNNISVKQSNLDVEASKIDIKGAKYAFAPSANLVVNHGVSWGFVPGGNGVRIELPSNYNGNANLSLEIDIYKGLQNQNNLRKSKLAQVAAQYKLTKMQEDIALNVANAYLQVLFNKENLKIQIAQKELNQLQLHRTEELIKAGSLPSGDVFDIKATLASTEQKIIAAENSLLISKLSLAQLIQAKDFDVFDVADPAEMKMESEILLQNPSAIYEKAKTLRTELKLAQTNLDVSQKDIAIAKGALQPTLRGSYGLGGFYNAAQSNLGYFDQLNNSLGSNLYLSLNVPIFNGFSARNNIERAKVSYQRNQLELEKQQLDLQRNVYTAYTDANGALNTYHAAIATQQARQQAFDYAKEKYQVGMMNSFDFSQSQTLLVNAQAEAVRAKYDYLFKIKIIEFYFGIPIIKN